MAETTGEVKVVQARIVKHMVYEGMDLADYPGYEIGTVHTVTDESTDDCELNGDLWVLKEEIEVIQ